MSLIWETRKAVPEVTQNPTGQTHGDDPELPDPAVAHGKFVLTNAPVALRMGTINTLAEKTGSGFQNLTVSRPIAP